MLKPGGRFLIRDAELPRARLPHETIEYGYPAFGMSNDKPEDEPYDQSRARRIRDRAGEASGNGPQELFPRVAQARKDFPPKLFRPAVVYREGQSL